MAERVVAERSQDPTDDLWQTIYSQRAIRHFKPDPVRLPYPKPRGFSPWVNRNVSDVQTTHAFCKNVKSAERTQTVGKWGRYCPFPKRTKRGFRSIIFPTGFLIPNFPHPLFGTFS